MTLQGATTTRATALTALLLLLAGTALGTMDHDPDDVGYHAMPFAMGPNGAPFCLISSAGTLHVRHLPRIVHCIHRTDDYSDRGLPDAQGNVDFGQPVRNGTDAGDILLEWYTDTECIHYLPGSDLVITCQPGDLQPRRPCHPNPCEYGGICKPFNDPLGIGYRCFCPFGQVDGRCAPPTQFAALYAGGAFQGANNVRSPGIVRWNGRQYAGFNGGVSRDVYSMVEFQGELIIGGNFEAVNQPRTQAQTIARWEGQRWEQLAGTGLNRAVLALAVFSNELYVGGEFTATVGLQVLPASFLARWDGLTWRSVGTGMDGIVRALTVQNGRLFIGGDFGSAGARPAKFIASWDGRAFASFGDELDGAVHALAPDPRQRSGLYVGGEFVKAGVILVNHIARWTGRIWVPLGSGFSGRVLTIAVRRSWVFAGGDFLMAGINEVKYLARFQSSGWTDVDGGVDAPVKSLLIANGTLFVGGQFINAGVLGSMEGGIRANGIASWRPGSSWQRLGEGAFNGVIHSLLSSLQLGLVIGGAFQIAGNPIVVNQIARLNRDETWSALGPGLEEMVSSIAGVPPPRGQFVRLFAGGFFNSAGGRLVRAIAEWDGCEWSDLDGGVNQPVYAVAYNPQNRSLYVGGEFTQASGLQVNRIARWDTVYHEWFPLGEGLGGEPDANSFRALVILPLGAIIFAAGFFTTAGAVSAPFIAAWNGEQWRPVGGGMSGDVQALTIFNSCLFAGGAFVEAGGVMVNSIAHYNGLTWAPVGSGQGANGVVAKLLSTDDFLYAAGWFTMMDGITVNYVARWDGAKWASLGPGVTSGFQGLAIFNGYLYAGGAFSGLADGSLRADRLLRWNLRLLRWETAPYELLRGAILTLSVVPENRWAAKCSGTTYASLDDHCPSGECYVAED